LWPDATESRAYASLRSALARLYGVVRKSMEVNPSDLRLAANVSVDLRESQALAHRLLDAVDQPLEAADLSGAAIAALSGELLPDWYEDWVLLEAENWRQLRLHALEAVARLLTAAGRYGDAAEAALAAVSADPLRESGRATLIKVHLAEHNRSEALREFKRPAGTPSLRLASSSVAALSSLSSRGVGRQTAEAVEAERTDLERGQRIRAAARSPILRSGPTPQEHPMIIRLALPGRRWRQKETLLGE
jgi:DNA-binding SARP family transcriptional activator